ncbi:N-alpha-acetyltransferase 25, NatB auxiliary subunit [Trichinella nativa]|uniref:N-terminal acetyltransferase B complex subunit MDM20 homolog n=1 Tax=Trichinella nativa TaxID=6335 RepID=A0A0V1LDF9_9BILA|nr:N-alpha-acetyltransferase 25, NatB auxiliary subunit [Trichinella nativa]
MSYLQIVQHLRIYVTPNNGSNIRKACTIYLRYLLDKGNVKRAIQDSDKFIKKYPQAPVAKALKTLCLIRYGRSGEADKLIEACFQCGPIDQLAMQALSYCFRELGKPHMLVVLYQRMLDQNPNNEDYMASLSLSHGRAGDFKMFGLQSMQLYKQVPNEKYYFWSVVSNVLQAHGQSESAMTLHLPLAQKMTVKYIKEHRNNINDNIIQLYLFILKMGSHHNEALRFLQSDLIQPEIHLKMYLAEEQLAVWERLGRHEEALEFSKERIRMKLTVAFLDELTDGWPFWNKMIDNFLCLLEVNQERRKRLFENFVEFFNERIEERSSHLARLYLVEKLIEKNLATVDELESFKLDVPAKLIAKYFEAFAHKPCFFDDVRPFLKLVTESEKNDFVSELAKIIGDLPITFHDPHIDMSFIKNQDDVQRHVHLLHICSVIGCYANLSSLELVQFSKQLLILFDKARRCNTIQNSSGIYPSDGYLSLAVHFIWLLYIMKQDDHWLYRLAVLLEQRLSFGKPNYEFVFRLTKIYSLLGCPGALLRVFNGSDIKLIMMESLYMMNDQLTPWGFYREYVMWCTNCVEFYSRASRDIMDNMLVALREGNYLKSIEIFRFRDAYEVSANSLFCRIRRQYYHLISEFQDFETLRESFLRAMTKDALFAEDRLNWLDTVDRRDYRVISQYLSLEEVDSFHSWNKCVFAQMMIQTTFQWTVLRLFCSLHELYTLAEESSFCEIQADPSSGSAGTGEPTLYMAHLKEDEPRPLRNALHHASQMRPIYADGISLDETQYEMVMYGSPVCYFGLYCRGHYFDLFELVLQTCLHYVQKAWLLVRGVESDDPRLKEDSSIFPPLDKLKERLRTMFCDHQFKEDSDLFPHMQLVHISFLLETFSLCMLVCLAVKSITTLIYPHVTRKTKKKNSEGKSGLAQVVEQLYRAVLSSDLDVLCSSGHFSVENLSMVYPYLLTRVFGVDIGRSLSPEGKNLLNKLVVDKRALEVFRMKLASVETPGKVEPPMIVELTTAGDGGLHFENCTPSQKLMLVRCEVAKGISAWHQARRTGTPVKQRSYCAADSERLVDDFADALFMLCYVADLMIRNAETSAEAYEERMWLIIRREKTLQYLCALTPECSSLFIRSAVEQLKLLGFVLQASMCYYSFEKLLSTLLQLIENNETLLWFFQFVKLSQKFCRNIWIEFVNDYRQLFLTSRCAVNLYSYLIFPLCLKIPRLASDVTIPSVDAIREAARCSKKFPKKSLAMLRKLRRCNPGGLFELLPELTDYARHLLDNDVAFALQQEYLSLWNYVELFYSRKLHGHTVASLKPSGTGVKFYSHTSLCDDIKQIVVCDERVFKVAPIFKILLRVLHCYFSAARLAVEQKIVINALVGGGKRKPGRSSSSPAIFEENNTSVGESVRKYAILNEVLCIQALLDSCMPENEQISIEEREVLVHLCNFLHQVFIAEPMLIKAIHHQGYSTKLISIIVRNVPSMHVCFDWIKQLITMSDLQIKIFSVELLSHLCVEHPIEKAYRCAEFLLNVLYTMLDKLESKQVLLFYSKILQAVMRICRIFQSLVVLAYKLFDKACIIVNVNCGGAIPVLPMTNELKKRNQVEQGQLEAEERSLFDAAVSDTTIITAIQGRNLQTEKEQFLIQVRSAFQHFIGHGLIDIAD